MPTCMQKGPITKPLSGKRKFNPFYPEIGTQFTYFWMKILNKDTKILYNSVNYEDGWREKEKNVKN